MRHKLSITIGEDTILQIRDALRNKNYRNKSHFFEIAAINLLEKEVLK
ncbi:hypothetical protein H8D36_05455 [archaeon]|nr:hypothetical protein [archaeon]MBL7057302.1 hypothetical protein [Candidatus Woesearchaeota archaeon]